jgi:AraC-like DNA-binding protein
MAALYLLLRRGNAFAPEVTPPLRLRRWAASFFAVSALGHVWWFLFYLLCGNLHSTSYIMVVVTDCVTLLTTIAGTLLAMLQDRKRPVWPAFAAMIPFVTLGVLQILYPDRSFMNIAAVYILSLYLLFSIYIAFAVRRYGRWLNDNYADLENKKVWLIQVVSLVCLLMFILYALIDTDNFLIYLLHALELVLFGLLLWRVETLPQLEEPPVQESTSLHTKEEQEGGSEGYFPNIDLAKIERLLAEHCVGTQLYLQHELTLQQLAQAIGTNRSYLSQYFARQGITYNTYINNLRINYFISSYQEIVRTHQPFTVQQLVSDSGYRSYSTFSRAFMQRMGQSVTAWMRQSAE